MNNKSRYIGLFLGASFIGLCLYIFLRIPLDSILMWIISKAQNIPSVCTYYLTKGGGEGVLDGLGCNNLRFTVELFSVAIMAGVVAVIMELIRKHDNPDK